jgi:hypothetical protein
MYYLLGYRLFGDLNIIEKLYKRKRKKNSSKNKSKLFKGFGNLLNNMDNKKRIQVKNFYNVFNRKRDYFLFLNRWKIHIY